MVSLRFIRFMRPALAAFAIAVAAPASAEHLRIEIKVYGMDCATCAHGLTVAMKKLQGVETVDISLNKSAAELRLRTGNTVTVEQLRTIIKHNGFTPKEAIVTTIATPARKAGALTLEVNGQPTVLAVAAGSAPDAVKALTRAAAGGAEAHTVSGTISRQPDGTEQIVVQSAAPANR
jgi:copper chaperone CopZ